MTKKSEWKLESKLNNNKNFQNVWDTSQSGLRGKCEALNTSVISEKS